MTRKTKAWKRLSLTERKAISRCHDLLREMSCVVTGRSPVTLHHCHSGSLGDHGINRGVGQRPSDWLVIPIVAELHIGPNGIDGSKGVRSWEAEHGRQIDHIKRLCRRTGINALELAGYGHIEIDD